MSRTVFIKTYGCQMNVYDSERIMGLLQGCGYTLAPEAAAADVILLNTCSIREKPEHKLYSILGRLKEYKDANPALILGVGGCVAQQEGEKLFEKAPHLDLVFGTHSIDSLPGLIKQVEAEREKVCRTGLREEGYSDEGVCCAASPGVSAYVSIIRGCNNFCSYCVVPYVRGREKSRPQEDIIQEIQQLCRRGVREVTLLGQNVNSYGSDNGRTGSFPRLLEAVNEVTGIERIRFITSHPKDLGDDLIRCFSALGKLCPHIHLPFQSGSNKILRLMNRGYTREEYLSKVEGLRRACPPIAITSDVIVGFPGETDEDFEQTLALMEAVRFDDLFSFNYSDRPMTAAIRFEGKIPPEVKRERLARLLEMQNEHSIGRNRTLLNTEEEVLVEGMSKKDGRRITGKTRSNKTVIAEGGEEFTGRLVPVRIRSVTAHTLSGDIVC
jgi:tRNA-2-methylthio-N6-dimethylallyladenosine synthase